MSREINVLALVKGQERYIFFFDDDRRAECLRALGKLASNAELSFTWYDAALLSQRVREMLPAPSPTLPRPLAERLSSGDLLDSDE